MHNEGGEWERGYRYRVRREREEDEKRREVGEGEERITRMSLKAWLHQTIISHDFIERI